MKRTTTLMSDQSARGGGMKAEVNENNIEFVVGRNVEDISEMKQDIRDIKRTNNRQDEKITKLESTLDNISEKVTRTDKTMQWVAKTIIVGIISAVITLIGQA